MKRTPVLLLLALLALAGLGGTLPAVATGVSPVAQFNPAAFELPEGLAVDRFGNFYVGMALTGEIKKVTAPGEVSTFAVLPNPAPGFMTGMAFDRGGSLYVGLASFNPASHGIWRVGGNGLPELYASLDPAGLPNGLAFDNRGNLFVSDSFLGQIWKVDRQGVAGVWKADPQFLGTPGPPLGLPIGANGIAFDESQRSLYVANTDFGRVLRVPMRRDQTAGNVEVFVADNPDLKGSDGIAFDIKRNLYVAVNRQDRLVVISPEGVPAVLAEGGLLQFPASLAFGAGNDKKQLYITNFALLQFLGIKPGPPMPALLELPVGVPGATLP